MKAQAPAPDALELRMQGYASGESNGLGEGSAKVLASWSAGVPIEEVVRDLMRSHGPRLTVCLRDRGLEVNPETFELVPIPGKPTPTYTLDQVTEAARAAKPITPLPRPSPLAEESLRLVGEWADEARKEPAPNGPTDIGGYREESGWKRSSSRRVVPQTGLYALTLWRPWGGLIIAGRKGTENREWQPWDRVVGKFIAIHAGAKVHKEAIARRCPDGGPWPEDPEMAIIGLALVRGYLPPGIGRAAGGECLKKGVERPFIADRDPNDPWRDPQQFGWIIGDTIALPEPIPCPGSKKLWPVEASIAERVWSQVA